MKLVIFGGGKMGEAIAAGLLARRWVEPAQLAIVEQYAARRDALIAAYPGVVVQAEMPSSCDGVVLCVKPGDVDAGVSALGAVPRLLSVLAGVTTARLEAALGSSTRVIRAMPNTPALVGAGMTALSAGSSADADDMAWARSIAEAVGVVVEVPEHQLDAVTGLSGSGPAYLYVVAEALIDAGVLNGLPRPVAEQLTRQLLLGAGQLLASSSEGPAELRAAVTSPGGTTAAGVRELEKRAVRSAFLEAVTAATVRSRELA
jgi:pyrroline-5-carboxylate reductase